MHLQKLQLLNFKNYHEATLEFTSRINVLVGRNGSGKTNLLDSIYYLAFTKSAFASADQHCIANGQNFFMIKGHFDNASTRREVLASVQAGSKKTLREDQVDYQKFSEHIGKYPVVLMAPDDVSLVKEGSEERRKFFDGIISQLDKKYLDELILYNNALKQRNSLLKMFYEKSTVDFVALEVYDQMLIRGGKSIYEKRKAFAEQFLQVFIKYYNFIVQREEETNLKYVSELHSTSYEQGLKNSRQRDLLLQRTNFGIHKDDYEFTLEFGDLKRLGSQGQQKSFVIALKLAQFEILENQKGFKPILLLDDIFDKLDDFRIFQLLELIKNQFGQLFITDARPDRTQALLKGIGVPALRFEVNAGIVKPFAE